MNTDVPLNGVSETLLVTTFYRAMETRSDKPLINDPVAVKIVDTLDYDFSRCTKWTNQATMAVRTRLFQDAIKRFLDQFPDAVVVNMAAGLDNRFSEMDNGTLRWYDLDLPPVIEVRRRYIEETERNTFLDIDVTDHRWMDEIGMDDPQRPLLIVAEGLFPYLELEQAKHLLATIATRFPNSQAVLEIFGSFIVGREWIVSEFRHIRPKPKFLWSPHDPNELGSWDPRFKVLAAENILDHYPEQWRYLWPVIRISDRVRHAIGNRIVSIDLNA